jgi:hypothetical protein
MRRAKNLIYRSFGRLINLTNGIKFWPKPLHRLRNKAEKIQRNLQPGCENIFIICQA